MKSMRKDLYAAAAAVVLFAVAAVVGHHLENTDGSLHLRWPPLYAHWLPHVGPGTPAALVAAGLTIVYGPMVARRMPWRGLVWGSWGASMVWVWSLALIDGWEVAASRLTYKYEYLNSVGDVGDISEFLSTFTNHILLGSPDFHWPAHVAGHPPGALLTFEFLHRLGLQGGGWAAVFVVTVASSAAAAVLVTVRALSGEETARRVAPFIVLAPAAVWLGVSADGYFAAVGAWAVALLALAATRTVRAPLATALGSGVLFGLLCYLSYGLVLMGFVGIAVLAAARTARPLPWVLLGMVPWFVVFTVGGFWWFDGYFTLVDRYYQGAASVRPYEYFIWANLAANVLTVGLATVAGLRRGVLKLPSALRGLRHAPATKNAALVVLVAGAACAMLAADLSGMSKAETERIWLPFALWLIPVAALLPERHHRGWLAAQAVVALTVNHLLHTGW